MSNPPDKKAQAVNSLIAFSHNAHDRGNAHLQSVLAEAFMENLYAWLLEKAQDDPPKPPDLGGG